MTDVVAGVALGVAGSVHCLAMCGPLVGVMGPALGRSASAVAWYQAGRVSSYLALGVVAGAIGQAALGGLGRGLAIGAGALMVLVAFGQVRAPRLAASLWATARLSRVMHGVARMRATRPVMAAATAGAVNGLLPCGLVYAAALAAAATGGIVSAAALMIAFGVGTLPAMLAAWFSSSIVPISARKRLRQAAPIAVGVVGLLLIGRGFGLTGSHVEAVADSNGVRHMHAAAQGNDEAAAVRAATQAWADAFNTRDPAQITALYDAEAVFWGTTSTTIRTTPAEVAEYFKDANQRPNVRVALGEQHVRVYGDVAINSGDYTFTDLRDGATVTNPSRFTFVYRKRGERWVIVDHHSSRRPQP